MGVKSWVIELDVTESVPSRKSGDRVSLVSPAGGLALVKTERSAAGSRTPKFFSKKVGVKIC